MSLITSLIKNEKISITELGIDFVIGALSAGSLKLKLVGAVFDGLKSGYNEFSESKNISKAVAISVFCSVSSICSVSNLIDHYVGNTDKVVNTVATLIFDTGASFSNLAVTSSISSMKFNERSNEFKNRKRAMILDGIFNE